MTLTGWFTQREVRFEAYSAEHLLLLLIFAVGAVVMVVGGRRLREAAATASIRRAFAALIAVAGLLNLGFNLTPADYDLDTSWPFQLCDLATVAAVVALWTQSARASAFLYYVGLTLTIQGILTPSLYQAFPDPRYLCFWVLHFGVVWAAVFLTWGIGVRPTWRGYWFSVTVTAVWAVAAFVFNAIAETNYGYLNAKPSTASALDLLGPWPMYVVVEVALLAGVWALMTWPWARGRVPR